MGRGGCIEFFLVTSVVGGILATVISLALGDRVEGLGKNVAAAGMWPFLLAVMVVYGKLHANESVKVNFLFWIKAKYLAVIYVLIYVAIELTSQEKFGALVALCNALVGFAFVSLGAETRCAGGDLRGVVRTAQHILSCEAAARGEEVHGVYAQAGQGREPG